MLHLQLQYNTMSYNVKLDSTIDTGDRSFCERSRFRSAVPVRAPTHLACTLHRAEVMLNGRGVHGTATCRDVGAVE